MTSHSQLNFTLVITLIHNIIASNRSLNFRWACLILADSRLLVAWRITFRAAVSYDFVLKLKSQHLHHRYFAEWNSWFFSLCTFYEFSNFELYHHHYLKPWTTLTFRNRFLFRPLLHDKFHANRHIVHAWHIRHIKYVYEFSARTLTTSSALIKLFHITFKF